jgi:hypothetical protein
MSATGARNSALTTRMGGTTMNTTATQLPASPSGNPGRGFITLRRDEQFDFGHRRARGELVSSDA